VLEPTTLRSIGNLGNPAYSIDDQTAITVVDGAAEIVSEGHGKQLA
jgi:dipeptidase E